MIKGDSRLSERKIAPDLNASLPELVTTRTIRRCLKDLAFEGVVKIKTSWLSVYHRQQRIAWCKRYLNWTKMTGKKRFVWTNRHFMY